MANKTYRGRKPSIPPLPDCVMDGALYGTMVADMVAACHDVRNVTDREVVRVHLIELRFAPEHVDCCLDSVVRDLKLREEGGYYDESGFDLLRAVAVIVILILATTLLPTDALAAPHKHGFDLLRHVIAPISGLTFVGWIFYMLAFRRNHTGEN